MTITDYKPGVERLHAQPPDPWIGVHELSQYAFCGRAGLNTTHLDLVDRGQDDNYVAPLDFEPEYEIGSIDRKVYVHSVRLLTWSVAVLVLVVFTVEWAGPRGPLGWLLGLMLALMSLVFAVSDALQLLFWCRQRWYSLSGANWLPDADSPEVEALNWWQLFRGGLASVSTAGGLRDDDLCLAGQPFKLLQRGDEYVPVFLRRGEGTRLFPQHYVRIAAYCLLLQRQTGLQSRYGIILQAGTFDCVAIKFNRETFDLLSQRLLEARRIIGEYGQLEQPPPKPPQALCRKCPFGRPIPIDSDVSLLQRQQTGLTPRGHIANDGRRYHCHCGDRFEWVPAHQRITELGIPH